MNLTFRGVVDVDSDCKTLEEGCAITHVLVVYISANDEEGDTHGSYRKVWLQYRQMDDIVQNGHSSEFVDGWRWLLFQSVFLIGPELVQQPDCDLQKEPFSKCL